MNAANPPAEERGFFPCNDRRTLEWITVLSAAGLEYRLERPADGWKIYVPVQQWESAAREIAAYEEDRRSWPAFVTQRNRPVQPPPLHLSPFWVVGLLVAIYVWLGPYDHAHPVLRSAAVDAEAVLAGEWWRVVTGLTVHADVDHLLGNIVSLLGFGYAVCVCFGAGLAWALMLAAGVGGNVLVCLLSDGRSLSVGASTACFGALGILCSRQALRNRPRYRTGRSIWDRTWLPLGAGLALLSLLGTGPRSDLAAHAYGMFCGMGLGLFSMNKTLQTFSPGVQRAWQLVTLLAVLMAWRAALSAAGR